MTDTDPPGADILIVTYNSADVLDDCLDSLLPYLSINDRVLVLDNASSDETLTILKANASRISVHLSDENLGFSRAINSLAAHRRPSSDILLLNPDATVQPDTVELLKTAIRDEPALAVVGPIVGHPEGRTSTLAAGGFPTVWNVLLHFSGIARLAASLSSKTLGFHVYEKHLPVKRALYEVDWISGGCCMISREAWGRVGGLNDRWFMYAEDIDFCWRAKKEHGMKVALLLGAYATHSIGSSVQKSGGSVSSMWVTNLYDFYKTSLSTSSGARVAWKTVVAGGLYLRGVVSSIKAIAGDPYEKNRSKRFRSNAVALVKA